ncbi:MAG: bacteriocin family protein [Firmicutes bacterium]|nr:bacteriocin family protein [Bacillota bacterium]MCL5039049.1 bacteriocin family protein [Bacillota bacterium]
MSEYLGRGQSPLTTEQWALIDGTVTEVARNTLVGRRFIHLFGPFGPGLQVIPNDTYEGAGIGSSDFKGQEESATIATAARTFIPLPIIYKDFMIHWRDLETSRQLNIPLDVSPAAAASHFCAEAEDRMIFLGGAGQPGLLKVEGRNSLAMGDWSAPGSAFGTAVLAVEKLTSAGFYAPYAMVLSPRQYAQTYRVFSNGGLLEIDHMKKVMTAGVYQSPIIPEGKGLAVACGPQNLDLAISQDLTTSFMETAKMNHYFRVFEILGLRIKRPGAICVLE